MRWTRRQAIRSGAFAALAAATGGAAARAQPAAAPVRVPNQEWQHALTPERVVELAREGNERFRRGERLPYDFLADKRSTAESQHPAAVVLGCIDSRVPAEIVFDAGIGDLFSARVAGNCVNPDIAGSMEYGCRVVGAKLVMVLGHTGCGAIKGAIDGVELGNLTALLAKLHPAVEAVKDVPGPRTSKNEAFVDAVARENVRLTLDQIRSISPILRGMESEREIGLQGAMYDVRTGRVEFLS